MPTRPDDPPKLAEKDGSPRMGLDVGNGRGMTTGNVLGSFSFFFFEGSIGKTVPIGPGVGLSGKGVGTSTTGVTGTGLEGWVGVGEYGAGLPDGGVGTTTRGKVEFPG